jgi:hypothetical protein
MVFTDSTHEERTRKEAVCDEKKPDFRRPTLMISTRVSRISLSIQCQQTRRLSSAEPVAN